MSTIEPRIEDRGAQRYLAIPASGVVDDFASAADSCFPELFIQINEHAVKPAGPPFIRYRVFDRKGRFEIECCVPVESHTPAVEPLHSDSLPAGRYAVWLHRGAYRATSPEWQGHDLSVAHENLRQWAAENGIRWQGRDRGHGPELTASVERYLVGPPSEPDPANWQTELAYLIA